MDGEYRSRWLKAISKRYSERSFNGEPISSGDECSVMECCAMLSAMFGQVRIEYAPLGDDKVFSGLNQLIADIKGARGLAAFIAQKDYPYKRQLVGMAGERFILECTDCGLKTCWVGGSYNKAEAKKLFSLGASEELTAVCPIGYSDNSASERKRLALHEICDINSLSELPEYITNAIEYARLAPSSMNRQPWKFEAGRDFLKICLDSKGIFAPKMQLIDIGIAAAHADIYLRSVLNEVRIQLGEDHILFEFDETPA